MMNSSLFKIGLITVVVALQCCSLAWSQGDWPPVQGNPAPSFQPNNPPSNGPANPIAQVPTAPLAESKPLLSGGGNSFWNFSCESFLSCDPGCTKTFFCELCPSTYAEVDALFMQRDPGNPSRTVLIDANTHATLVSSANLDFGFDPGVRALWGFHVTDCLALEFGYFGLFDASGHLSYAGSSSAVDVRLPGPLGDVSNVFHDGVRTRTNYGSQFQGAEVNLACCCCCEPPCCPDPCSVSSCGAATCGGTPCGDPRYFGWAGSREWFVGFRYLSLNESFHIYGEKEVLGLLETAHYDVSSYNNLYGVQIGGRIHRYRGRFCLEVSGKAGIYGNQCGQEQTFIDYPGFPLRPTVSKNGGSVAFSTELNFGGLYQINETWGLSAGYNVMWIGGVALAPDQLDFTYTPTSGTGLFTGGSVFLHGFNVGIEARW
jgi:hypothetical protein